MSNVLQQVFHLTPFKGIRREVLFEGEDLGGQARRVAATPAGQVVVAVVLEGPALRVFDNDERPPRTLCPPAQAYSEPDPYPLLRLSPDGSHAALVLPDFLWVTPLAGD